jgi:hypothetical protein
MHRPETKIEREVKNLCNKLNKKKQVLENQCIDFNATVKAVP